MPPIISLPSLNAHGRKVQALYDFESKLVRHAAPTLARIKPANLFTYRYAEGAREQAELAIERVDARLAPYGVRVTCMATRKQGILVLAWRPAEVRRAIAHPRASALLQRAGLESSDVDALVRQLQERILAADADRIAKCGLAAAPAPERVTPCCAASGKHHRHEPGHICQCRAKAALAREEAEATLGEAGFPHEIGLVLGYPAADVEGFMENAGAGYVACGGWKAYGNAEEALRAFKRNRECTAQLRELFEQGAPLEALMPAEAGLSQVSIFELAQASA